MARLNQGTKFYPKHGPLMVNERAGRQIGEFARPLHGCFRARERRQVQREIEFFRAEQELALRELEELIEREYQEMVWEVQREIDEDRAYREGYRAEIYSRYGMRAWP